MSFDFELDGAVALFALLLPLSVLTYAVVTIPRWCIRSVTKHAIWRLRDDIVDDTLTGTLPRDHKAVQELILMADWAVNNGRSFDLLHLIVWVRACRHMPDELRRSLRKQAALVGLTPDEVERVKAYRSRYLLVANTALLLSSWMGVVVMLWVAVPALFKLWRKRIQQPVSLTAAKAAADTRLGRYSREYVWEKPHDSRFGYAPA